MTLIRVDLPAVLSHQGVNFTRMRRKFTFVSAFAPERLRSRQSSRAPAPYWLSWVRFQGYRYSSRTPV
jgi:hypothetical protein